MSKSDEAKSSQPEQFQYESIVWDPTSFATEQQLEVAQRTVRLLIEQGASVEITTTTSLAANLPMSYIFGNVRINYDPSWGGIYNPVGRFYVPVPATAEELAEHLAFAEQYESGRQFFAERDLIHGDRQ